MSPVIRKLLKDFTTMSESMKQTDLIFVLTRPWLQCIGFALKKCLQMIRTDKI